MRIETRNRLAARYVLVALLAAFGVLKLFFNPLPYSDVKADDGAYYYQVARNFAEGRGLTTNVSLFHHGFETLPHAITYYPLWMLTLGLAGRVFPLESAAHWLPELLYLVALGLLYPLANRIGRVFDPAGPAIAYRHASVTWGTWRPEPLPINMGHVAVTVFGLNHVFFRFTSLTFTEALAFTLLFAAVLLSTHPSTLAAATRGYFHQWTCWDPIDQVRAIAEHGRVTHVLVYPEDRSCEAYQGLTRMLGDPLVIGDWTLWAVATSANRETHLTRSPTVQADHQGRRPVSGP